MARAVIAAKEPAAGWANRRALALEFLLIFAAGPLVVAATRERLLLALLLWAGALGAWRVSRQRQKPCTALNQRRELRRMAQSFAMIAPLLGLAAWLTQPGQFLAFPLERPGPWLGVMLGYPLLSVWPQEVLFRRFALVRYAPLFGTGPGFIVASGLAFGFAHVIFFNPVAVALSTLGGFMFAANYARHRSLPLVCLEHALYGCLIFTIGLGHYFFSGAAWQP